MEVAPFFVDFHHFLSIFTIFYRFSQFTHFCRDLHFVAIYALFPQFFFGQNSLLRNITRFLHVWGGSAKSNLHLYIVCCPLHCQLSRICFDILCSVLFRKVSFAPSQVPLFQIFCTQGSLMTPICLPKVITNYS